MVACGVGGEAGGAQVPSTQLNPRNNCARFFFRIPTTTLLEFEYLRVGFCIQQHAYMHRHQRV